MADFAHALAGDWESSMNTRFFLAGLLIAAAPLFAHADEASVKKAASDLLKSSNAVDSVHKLPVGGVYEIVLADGKILYTDEDFSYFHVGGELIMTKGLRNLTDETKERLSHVDFASLPLKQAFKRVHGKGSRKIALFEDPNCGYCKKLENDLQNVDDLTVYVFPVAVLGEDSVKKAKQLWCADDKGQAWNKWMLEAKLPAVKSCDDVIEKNNDLAREIHLSGTPTMVLSNGTRLVGYVTPDKLQAAIAAAIADKAP